MAAGPSISNGRNNQAAPPELLAYQDEGRILPRLKRPEEIRELLRLCRVPLQGTEAYKEDEVLDDEIEAQRIRLTGRHWLKFLEVRGLIDIGKDPARHPFALRQEFLAQANKEGVELISREEAIDAVHEFINSRRSQQIKRACSYTENLAADFATLFGTAEIEKVMQKLAWDFKLDRAPRSDGMPHEYDEEWVRKSLGATVILEAYIQKSMVAQEILGRDNVLVGDWQRSGMLFHEFESIRRKTLNSVLPQLNAVQEARPQIAKPSISANADHLKEGECVELEVVQKGPLGYVVRVEGEFDGLIYHSDIFDMGLKRSLKNGELIEGWVLKVRADGKVDVTLRPPGAKAKITDGVAKVLEVLRKRGGNLPLGDKSKPSEIYEKLGLSKKVFKEAIGRLYKMHMVELEDSVVRLLPENQWRTNIAKPPESKSKAQSTTSKAQAPNSKASESNSKAAVDARGKQKQVAHEESMRLTRQNMDLGMPRVEMDKEQSRSSSANLSNKGAQSHVTAKQQRKGAPGGTNMAARGGVEELDEDDDGRDLAIDAVKSREEVMARLEADALEAKEMAKRRLEAKREKEKVAQQRRIIKEREKMDPTVVEKRRMLMDSVAPITGSGLKATMARLRQSKGIKPEGSEDAPTQSTANNKNSKNNHTPAPTIRSGSVGVGARSSSVGVKEADWEHPEAPGSVRTVRAAHKAPIAPINAESVAAITNLDRGSINTAGNLSMDRLVFETEPGRRT